MKTSKEDFKKFQDYCLEWRDRLGLLEWSLFFNHEELEGVYAKTRWDTNSMMAVVNLAKSWDKLRPKTDVELKRLALHEILHVLVAPLCSEAMWRYTSENAIEIAEHSIIRRLENVL